MSAPQRRSTPAQGDSRNTGQRTRRVVVSRRVPGLPTRLRGHDLKGAGEDPEPPLPLPNGALALGGEHCRADPPARNRAGVRRAGNSAQRGAARTADGRFEVKAASVAWAAEDELTPGSRASQDLATARRAPQLVQAPTDWLIPPNVSPDERDSLGRGLNVASVARAVSKDAQVQAAKAEPWRHLEHAYRDPHAAHARLADLLNVHGWIRAAEHVAAEPTQLGRLRSRDGLIAGRFAQLDRASAISAGRSVGYRLIRIADAAERAERDYRESVGAQMRRDVIGIPKLSAAATAVLEAVHAVRTERSGDPWHLSPSPGRAALAQAWETSSAQSRDRGGD
jgi:hypothetical protein